MQAVTDLAAVVAWAVSAALAVVSALPGTGGGVDFRVILPAIDTPDGRLGFPPWPWGPDGPVKKEF